MGIIVTYLRSSSYNTWDFCQHKYFLDYTLGFHSPANKKAEKGTIVHKALEIVAKLKICQQERNLSFLDNDFGELSVTTCTPDLAIELAFKNISEKQSCYDWNSLDFKDCRNWMWEALLWKDGMFSPAKREVISAEQYFDFCIDKPWAKYHYQLPGNKILDGYLSMKGTLDLIVKSKDPETIELIDWKTGRRMDWNTGQEKTQESLYHDPQLRMYHYAACRLYPKVKNVFITIFYITDGGPFSLCFQRSDMSDTEQMLCRRFETIKNTFRPKLIYPDWKCSKLCWHGLHTIDGVATGNYIDSACHTIKKELVELGVDKVTNKYAKDKSFGLYGEGGGRKHE
jgi:hypothetical protein